jgi:DNA-binding winged helix-turn-helix (wHTH) protein
LWWDDLWVAIPSAQLPVVQLLVTRVRDLVRRDELVSVYEAAGGSPNPIAVKAMFGRLVKRFAEVGLVLHSVRGRGYLLDAPNSCPLHARTGGAHGRTDPPESSRIASRCS